jgi:pimeloyl-ACP methyl ester carboxylesterase
VRISNVRKAARNAFVSIAAAAAVLYSEPSRASDLWLTLPPTPTLPKAEHSGYAAVADARIWYAIYGKGETVILLHGGLANAAYLGLQVRALAPYYRVIVMDSRCHGRSTCGSGPIGYHRMAGDVTALMDYLHVKKAAIVGWSDGAIVGLDIAIHHPERLSGLFAFAANSDPSGTKDVTKSPAFIAYTQRTQLEYTALSSTPAGYDAFLANVEKMWATQPHFTRAQLHGITVRTWIVDADHDEAIERSDTDYMASAIPGAGELILPGVGHFAFLQDPVMFDGAILHFLQTQRKSSAP